METRRAPREDATSVSFFWRWKNTILNFIGEIESHSMKGNLGLS